MGHLGVVIHAIQRGFTVSLPLIFIGVVAICLRNVPSAAFQNWAMDWSNGYWIQVCDFFIQSTYEIVSLTVLCGISIMLALALSERSSSFAAMSTIIAIAVFIMVSKIFFGGLFSAFPMEVGLPLSIVIPVITTYVFRLIAMIPPLRIAQSSVGFSPTSFDLFTFFPAVCVTLLIFGGGVYALWEFVDFSVSDLIQDAAFHIFVKEDQPLLGALLLVLASQCLWLLGIHGPAVLFLVREGFLYPMGEENAMAVQLGGEPLNIITNQFVNAFSHMGGAGSTLALIIAILWKSKDQGTRNLCLFALVTAIFNVNGLLIFGIPIAYNPIYAIPFILVPIVELLIAYGATALDLVPRTVVPVPWSMPPFLSGYLATGSVSGTVLQVVNLGIGLALYLPFLSISERVNGKRIQAALKALNSRAECVVPPEEWKKCLHSPGMEGHVARILADELSIPPKGINPLGLVYQPQVDIRTNTVMGVEALLRWKSLVFGVIPPPTIIALSEDTGMVSDLGYRIFDQACSDFAIWIRAGVPDCFTMSINISPRQLTTPDLAERILDVLRTHGIPPNRIEVEITESVVIASTEIEYRNIQVLHSSGIHLVIDDFGMGYTSLRYLNELPINKIKIDKSLTQNMEASANRHIVTSIVSLSSSIGTNVVVEGIEDADQLSVMTDLGCHTFQGYYFSRPLASEDALSFILHFKEEVVAFEGR
ncbi:EAL domain-containing protein [Rhodospirillum sp. A1_3_36]|uniref:EAL domain-containing protein n=1 Tax=Rhodospirillum sp. A1_3_36 TaxID=3391666 RepID=UPI0039A754F7